ncbi:MAG: ABC transporter ATP-binding protein [Acidimicrobiia bacterium]|nr:ABC transporter ATP-binding protein [Acidimicrobiia bacterium]
MSLTVRDLSVTYGSTVALDSLNLTIASGERFAIMGPSGSGKSSLLWAIAGIVPCSGSVIIDGEDISQLPTHQRPIGLMFQDYALFPHMNVADNVAYGLRMQGMARSERMERARELLDLVGLGGFESRNAATLSGGEQQRVALARTLAPEPSVVMFDEPLGSLDSALRESLLDQMRHIVSDLGTTSLYVTHDRGEAFAFADRLAVLVDGSVARIGSPQEVWSDPGTVTVARLIGHPNIVSDGLGSGAPLSLPVTAISRAPGGGHSGVVVETTFTDGRYRVTVALARSQDQVSFLTDDPPSVGAPITLSIDEKQAISLQP